MVDTSKYCVDDGRLPGTARTPASGGIFLDTLLPASLKNHHQLVKYVLIGGTASAIDLVLFLGIHNYVGKSELVAHSVSVPVAVLFSFLVNARHNFAVADCQALRFVSFVFVCLIGYLAGLFVIQFAVQAGLDANTGKVLSLPLVFAIQYLLNSRITFARRFFAIR